MSIEAIGALSATAELSPSAARPAVARSGGADFGHMIGDGIARLDEGLQAADVQLRSLAAGKDVAVHDVMISMENARMNLMFMVEVRNKAVEAYQELMRMQL